MDRTMTKLTPEDIAWLESRLNSVIEPIMPSPEFIHRAKQELMEMPSAHPLPGWVKPGALAAFVLSLLALIGALFFFHNRE
jgi:hypothetical protein